MHADFARTRIERKLLELERDLIAALKHCHHEHHDQPASITLTVQ